MRRPQEGPERSHRRTVLTTETIEQNNPFSTGKKQRNENDRRTQNRRIQTQTRLSSKTCFCRNNPEISSRRRRRHKRIHPETHEGTTYLPSPRQLLPPSLCSGTRSKPSPNLRRFQWRKSHRQSLRQFKRQ